MSSELSMKIHNVQDYTEYYRFILNLINLLFNKRKLAEKEEEFMIILLFCARHNIRFFSKEFKNIFSTKGWNESHLYIYRSSLIRKEWLEVINENGDIDFKDNLKYLLSPENHEITIQMKVVVENTAMEVFPWKE